MALRYTLQRRNEELAPSANTGESPHRGGAPERKILLVDADLDELDIAAYVLRRDGFAVVETSEGPQALSQFRVERPDLVVVSLELPAPGGIEILRQIRAESRTPVVVMTSRSDKHDVFLCIELGADDFISKPHALLELPLRIHAILSRLRSSVRADLGAAFELGDLRLDPETHEVARGSSEIRLTPTEFRIFFTLVKNAERVVPANRLLTYVSGGQGGAANSLRSHICHLRRKLALDGGARGSIVSLPTVGYVFRAPPLHDLDARSESALRQVAVGS